MESRRQVTGSWIFHFACVARNVLAATIATCLWVIGLFCAFAFETGNDYWKCFYSVAEYFPTLSLGNIDLSSYSSWVRTDEFCCLYGVINWFESRSWQCIRRPIFSTGYHTAALKKTIYCNTITVLLLFHITDNFFTVVIMYVYHTYSNLCAFSVAHSALKSINICGNAELLQCIYLCCKYQKTTETTSKKH